jgi:hypothetical protein
MNVNRKKLSIETISQMGGGKDKREWWREQIEV